MRKILILLLIAIILISSSNISNSQTVVVSGWGWGTPQNPIKAHPGYNDTPFYVIVSQPLGYQIVYAILNLVNTPITSEGGSSIAYGSVTSSSLTTSQITFFLNVLPNAKAGMYNVPLTIIYQNTLTGTQNQITQMITIPIYNVTFPILEEIFWGTSQQLTFAQVGEGLVPLTFVIFNPTTNPMFNITLNVYLPKGIYSQNGENRLNVILPALPPGEPEFTTTIVNVSNEIKPGNYQINYSISFTDFLGYFYRDNNQTSIITIYPQAKLSISSNAINANPGNTSILFIRISSNVSSFIVAVKPELTSTSLIPISSNFTPTSLQPGQEVIFYFKFYIPQDVLPTIYPIPIEINYTALGESLSSIYLTYANIYYNQTPKIVEILWNTTITPFPGIGVVPLTLLVYNPLPFPITAVNITYKFPNGIIPLQPYVFVPAIPQFQALPLTIPVEITPNTSIGDLNFSYKISYDQGKITNGSDTIYILPPSPVIIDLNKTIIPQGSYTILPVKIINLGSEYIYNLNIFISTEGLEIITSVNNTIPYLKPNSSITFYYTIYAPQSLPATVYPLIIRLAYTYFTSEIIRTFTAPVFVITYQQPLLISLLKTTVYYNTNNTEILEIENLANYTIYNLKLQLDYPSQEIYMSSNTFYIPYLPPHQIYTTPFYIIPQIPQTMSIPIMIISEYTINGATETYQEQLSLLSAGFVRMEITQVSAQVVNNSVVINGLLINTGSQNAQYVTLYVNNYTSIYIGNVPPNSPTPFSFTLSLPPGKYTFNITVSYENQLYQPNSTYYILPFIVSYATFTNNGTTKISVTTILLLALVISLLSIIIYLSIRRLRK